MAPFFDTAQSSKNFHPRLSFFYAAYAALHSKSPLGLSLIERGYCRLKGIPDITHDKTLIEPPTHGEALALRNYGRRVQDRKALVPDAQKPALPRTFILGLFDGCACPQTASKLADQVNGETIMLNAGHNPFEEIREGLTHVARAAFQYGGLDDQAALALPDRARHAAWMRLQASVNASLDVA